ncbi:Gfo/Idh/MocA family protein [Acidobacteriota bacterium]
MKILIVGLGSIGRKHLECLQQYSGVDVTAFRTSKGAKKESSGIIEFTTLQNALAYEPNGVIISNPTALHATSALPFLRKGIKVLIEKPIAESVKEAEKLVSFKELIRVAYCLRFYPVSDFVKHLCLEESIFRVSFRRSYYLPKWHSYADYRLEYSSRKDLGGGVIRTLSHELDLMLHWFGWPDSVVGVTDRVSPLEIDVDDFAFFTARSKNGVRISFDLDFFSPENINTGDIFTEKGKYTWDHRGIWFSSYENSNQLNLSHFREDEINNMYMRQTEDFLNFVRGENSQNATYKAALNVLELIERIDC